MKKWFKNLYKIYLAAFVAILACLIFEVFWMADQLDVDGLFRNMTSVTASYPQWSETLFADNVIRPLTLIRSLFFDSFKKVLLFGILLLHAFMLWGEKSSEQREFIATLPARKYDREIVRAIMDIVLVISTAAIAALTCYLYINHMYMQRDMEITWLGSSIFGLAVTTICYVIVLVGFVHFIEALVVRGDMKIIVSIACIIMLHLTMKNLFYLTQYDSDNILIKIYGFMNLCTVGGGYYADNQWEHEPLDIYVTYKGESGAVFGNYSDLSQLVDMSNVGSYIWYAMAYLLIGATLLGLAICLVKRQELSRSRFYFRGGTTLIGLMISITCFSFGVMFSPALWNTILLAITAVMIFVGFVYIVDRH